MHILLTNDDGIFAPGIAALYRQLVKLGRVTVAAPSDVQSGAGHSITLDEITCQSVEIVGSFSGYSIGGSPADCVKLALKELISPKEPVDLVVSGMNHGANVGINVFYSGTVAGAIEGAFYKLPAIAVSASYDDPFDVDKAAAAAFGVIEQLLPLPAAQVVSINIPRLSVRPVAGVKVVPQSTTGFDESYMSSDSDKMIFRLTGGKCRDTHDPNNWTDTTALAAGYITLTSLRQDLTDAAGNERLGRKTYKA